VDVALDAAMAGRPGLALSVGAEEVGPGPAVAELPEAPSPREALVEDAGLAAGLEEQDDTAVAQAETLPESEEPAPAAPAVEVPMEDAPESPPPQAGVEPPPALRLSTDGGPEAAGTGPALHEAVRMRMAADERRPVRRAPVRSPPRGTPPVSPPIVPLPGGGEDRPHGLEPMLSPDEMDALLRDDDVTAGEEPLVDESEGGEK
jgi:hypothetical protein